MTSGRGRVLVVDDDADLRNVVATRLCGAGYEVFQAESGEEAVERITRGGLEAVLLDIRMPGMSGFDVMKILQGNEDPPAVIFLTALGAREPRLRAFAGGAQDYLVKPFDPEELLARVSTAVGIRRKLASAQEESLRDGLTDLGNRRAFDRAFPEEVARARRYRHPLSLLLADADGLKAVNDTAGHMAGDDFLRAVARAIQATGRETDRSFRIGGDEFGVLLPETGPEMARHFHARLRRALSEERYTASGERRIPSASAGLAVFPDDAETEADLMAAADRDLYRAKRAPRSAA